MSLEDEYEDDFKSKVRISKRIKKDLRDKYSEPILESLDKLLLECDEDDEFHLLAGMQWVDFCFKDSKEESERLSNDLIKTSYDIKNKSLRRKFIKFLPDLILDKSRFKKEIEFIKTDEYMQCLKSEDKGLIDEYIISNLKKGAGYIVEAMKTLINLFLKDIIKKLELEEQKLYELLFKNNKKRSSFEEISNSNKKISFEEISNKKKELSLEEQISNTPFFETEKHHRLNKFINKIVSIFAGSLSEKLEEKTLIDAMYLVKDFEEDYQEKLAETLKNISCKNPDSIYKFIDVIARNMQMHKKELYPQIFRDYTHYNIAKLWIDASHKVIGYFPNDFNNFIRLSENYTKDTDNIKTLLEELTYKHNQNSSYFSRMINFYLKHHPKDKEDINSVSKFFLKFGENIISENITLNCIKEINRTFNLLETKCKDLPEEAKQTAYDWAYKAINANYKKSQKQGRETLKQIQDFLENDEKSIKMLVYTR